MTTSSVPAHRGPHPGILASLYTLLFCVGLYPVTGMYKKPYWPGPWRLRPDEIEQVRDA